MNEHNSYQLTDKELENVIGELETADVNHLRWLKCVHSSLICKHPFETDVLLPDAHTHCRFGHWYYNNAPEMLRQRPEFVALDDMHKAMHDSVRGLATQSTQGETITTTEYTSFIDKQQTFSKSLLALRDRLRENLLAFDPLTGLMTRRPFTHILNAECARAKRNKSPYCLTMMDIDYFKKINDTHGHLSGDRVLTNVAQFLLQQLRGYDTICRYGGEEFLVSLPMTNLSQATNVMERIRDKLEHYCIEYEDNTSLNVTISIGVASVDPSEGVESCLKQADEALYNAKRSGRNRVCWHDQPRIAV